jgi:hypothetical protein
VLIVLLLWKQTMDKLLIGGLLVFFTLLFGALIAGGINKDNMIAEIVAKSNNPIQARCAMDHAYAKDNATLCSDALKKETK